MSFPSEQECKSPSGGLLPCISLLFAVSLSSLGFSPCSLVNLVQRSQQFNKHGCEVLSLSWSNVSPPFSAVLAHSQRRQDGEGRWILSSDCSCAVRHWSVSCVGSFQGLPLWLWGLTRTPLGPPISLPFLLRRTCHLWSAQGFLCLCRWYPCGCATKISSHSSAWALAISLHCHGSELQEKLLQHQIFWDDRSGWQRSASSSYRRWSLVTNTWKIILIVFALIWRQRCPALNLPHQDLFLFCCKWMWEWSLPPGDWSHEFPASLVLKGCVLSHFGHANFFVLCFLGSRKLEMCLLCLSAGSLAWQGNPCATSVFPSQFTRKYQNHLTLLLPCCWLGKRRTSRFL